MSRSSSAMSGPLSAADHASRKQQGRPHLASSRSSSRVVVASSSSTFDATAPHAQHHPHHHLDDLVMPLRIEDDDDDVVDGLSNGAAAADEGVKLVSSMGKGGGRGAAAGGNGGVGVGNLWASTSSQNGGGVEGLGSSGGGGGSGGASGMGFATGLTDVGAATTTSNSSSSVGNTHGGATSNGGGGGIRSPGLMSAPFGLNASSSTTTGSATGPRRSAAHASHSGSRAPTPSISHGSNGVQQEYSHGHHHQQQPSTHPNQHRAVGVGTSSSSSGSTSSAAAAGRLDAVALSELSARVSRTETALAELNQQVASLNTLVKGLQISITTPGGAAATPGGGMGALGTSPFSTKIFSPTPPDSVGIAPQTTTSIGGDVGLSAPPLEPTDSGSTITPAMATASSSNSHTSAAPGADIANLSQQVAALTASIAQLQRMQSSFVRRGDARLAGGNVNDNHGVGYAGDSGAPHFAGHPYGDDMQGGGGGGGGFHGISPAPTPPPFAPTPSPSIHSATAGGGGPGASSGGYFASMQIPRSGTPRAGKAGVNGGGGANPALAGLGTRPRPNMGRSVSTGANGGHALGGPSVGPMSMNMPFAHGFQGLASPTANLQAPPDWPMRADPPTPGAASGGAAAAGGPGATVTKWDHLPLTSDLQRQIAKYGIGPPNKIQARALPFMLKGSDIIAQAPPTQERIITYVIPVIQLCLSVALLNLQPTWRGPSAIILTTTVDQATQAQKLIRDIGAPLGIRSALAVGAGGADLSHDLRMMYQNQVQVVIGTPARLHDVFVKYQNNGGPSGADVRMLVLDEVDQLIARNLYDYCTGIVKLLPQPKSRSGPSSAASNGPGVIGVTSPAAVTSPYDAGMHSPFNPASMTPFPATRGAMQNAGGGGAGSGTVSQLSPTPERQTCLFSNTIPTDVINFSQSIQVREPVRVLVRREGGVSAQTETNASSGTLRHYYLYLAVAAGGASGRGAGDDRSANGGGGGPGTIGSGRAAPAPPSGPQAMTEASQAKEWKLEALASMLADYPLWQAIVHVGSHVTMEAVTSKLQSRQMEAAGLVSRTS